MLIDTENLINEYKAALAEEKSTKKKVAQLKAKILEESKPNIEFGTAHFDNYSIVITKNVVWDQDALAELSKTYNFVKAKYDVSETLFKALPEEVQADFENARTLKQGTATIKLKDD